MKTKRLFIILVGLFILLIGSSCDITKNTIDEGSAKREKEIIEAEKNSKEYPAKLNSILYNDDKHDFTYKMYYFKGTFIEVDNSNTIPKKEVKVVCLVKMIKDI